MYQKSIVVLGSINQDHVINTPHLPQKGETVLGKNYFTARGGKGANQALAATRLGAKVNFISCAGQDNFALELLQDYQHEGMETAAIKLIPNEQTGVALVCIDSLGNNFIAVSPNANQNVTKEYVHNHRNLIEESHFLLMQLETPLSGILHAATLAHQNQCKIILNPAPACALPDTLLKLIYLITPNEGEAEQLTGITINDESSALEAAQTLQAKGVQNVVITLGGKGAFYCDSKGNYGTLPAYSVTVQDTTAAGDTFNGALVVALNEGKSLLAALQFASQASAICVTRLGAQSSIPYRHELQQVKQTITTTIE